MTGCQQEEVIERITEKESWRSMRREQGDRGREREAEVKERTNWRMNKHANFTSTMKKIRQEFRRGKNNQQGVSLKN